jgi:hypothetical protein
LGHANVAPDNARRVTEFPRFPNAAFALFRRSVSETGRWNETRSRRVDRVTADFSVQPKQEELKT